LNNRGSRVADYSEIRRPNASDPRAVSRIELSVIECIEQFAANLQVLTLRNSPFLKAEIPNSRSPVHEMHRAEGSEPTGTGRQSVTSSNAAEVGVGCGYGATTARSIEK
jgi:hypothetical protein